MRVLIINKFLYPNGGSETYIFKLGEALEQHGHEVQYFGMEHEGRCVGNRVNAYTSGMDFHGGSKLSKLTYPIKTIYSKEARVQLRKVLDDFKPDVCHLNNFNYQLTPSIILEIVKWRKETGRDCKIIFTAHDYQLVCPNHMLNNPNTHQNCEKCLGGHFVNCMKGKCIHGSTAKSAIGMMEAEFWKWKDTYKYIDTMICCSEFMKTKMDSNPLFATKTVAMHMLLTPVMHTDCTNARYNGKSAYVFICADPKGNALYFARKHKGLEGVKGTVTEDYQGTLVHDHELTFFNFGSNHQECLAHVLRYLKDSMENEPDRTWNQEMHALVTEMIHYRNETAIHAEPDFSQISAFEARYDEILKMATDEYDYVLPSKYYRDGYNLYRRMEKFKQAHLRFLYDYTIPTTNNAAERYLRNYKRKQKQAISFRSFTSIEDLCYGKSVLIKIRKNDGANVFQEVAQRFDS